MCVYDAPYYDMPRLNIYVTDELDLELRRHPGEINISRVCADAIRAHLAAHASNRSIDWLFTSAFDAPTELDNRLRQRFALRAATAGETWGTEEPHEIVAMRASEFLNRTVSEGLRIAVGGGTQIYSITRRLEPRNLGMHIWALGYGQVDHEMPHVHPNAVTTFLSLLYAPRSKAALVGAQRFRDYWSWTARIPQSDQNVKRLIVGSCAMFDAESPYAKVLGKEMTDFLMDEHVMGDFLGVFIKPDGTIIEPYAPSMTVSHIPSSDLRAFSKRDDAMVLLAAAGGAKVKLIRQVLELGLCNALITDDKTARALL
jgi:DNA-binding transcriptional regulator LsrR (DeoR family)